MDPNRLRRLVAEVDEEHREAMRTIHDDLSDTFLGADAGTRASRRGFLKGLGLGGAVLTVGSTTIAMSAVTAAAQTATTTASPTTVPATTTTAPPKQPTNEDLVVLAFAQSLELAAVETYKLGFAALDASEFQPLTTAFGLHHEQHAQAFSGLAGKAALGRANQAIVDLYGPRLRAAETEKEALGVLFELETAAASTYVAFLGELQGTNGSETVASIQPIEARHAVVLGQAAELPLDELSPSFEVPADGLNPSDYPIIPR